MIHALTSSALSGLIRAGLQFATISIIATFVKASDYGLYALALPFAILTAILFDAGFGPLVVRPATIAARMIASLHALALIVGALSAVILLAASFGVGTFFPDPRLPIALKVMAVVPLLGLAAAVPRAVLERELRYDTIAKVEVGSLVIASSVAIALAVAGAGVWSLFALTIVQAATRCAALNRIQPVSTRGSTSDLRRIYADGKWITLQNLQVYLNRNLDNILVGAYLGTAALGVYALAYQVVIVPLQAVAWPFGAVLMSQLRRLDTPASRTKALDGVLVLALWLIAPSLAVAAVVSPELVALYMKPSWSDLPFLVQVLSLSCIAQVLGSFHGTILVSLGKLRVNFAIGLFNTICLSTIFLVATLFFDLHVMVVSYAAYCVVYGLGLLTMSYWRTGSSLTAHMRFLAAPLVTAFVVLGAGLGAGMMLPHWPATTVLLCKAGICGAVITAAGVTQIATLKSLLTLLGGPVEQRG
jgi:O-antigen/teichoic acid export membrane protein